MTINSNIDWRAIWKLLSLDSSSLITSFVSTRLKSFIFKNFTDELPVITRMVQLLPDIYKDWNCVSCNVNIETSTYIWRCPAYFTKITAIISFTKIRLNQLLEVFSPHSFLQFELNSVLDQIFDILSDTGLVLIMKALIPCSLVSVIQKITRSGNKSLKIIIQLLLFFFQKMYEEIWKPRCKLMIAKEKSLNITSKDKHLRGVSKFLDHTNNHQFPNMWETWLHLSIKHGNKFSDF
jgi:hypothetical protein